MRRIGISSENLAKMLKDSFSTDAGRDWEQEEKGMTEDEMARWQH